MSSFLSLPLGFVDEISDEIMRRVEDSYRLFREGDLSFFEGLDPEIEWKVSDSLPGGGDLRGIDEVIAHLEAVGELFEGAFPEPEEFIRGKDSLMVLGTWRARVKATGAPVEARFAHVGQYRNGRLLRFRNYIDSAKVLQALR